MVEAAVDRPRDVLLLAGVFEVRGSSGGTLRLAEHLPEHGFVPRVVCHHADRVGDLRRERLQIREYGSLGTPLIGRLTRRVLLADLRAEPPELIHAQTRDLLPLASWLAGKLSRPLVVSVHGLLGPRETLAIDRRWGRRVLAVSQAVRETLVGRVALAEECLVVVPSGVDLPEGRPPRVVLDPDHVPVVGTAGPLEAIKGLPFFLGAAQKVLATGRDVEFVVAGAGPEERNLRRLAEQLGIATRVTFAPNLFDFDTSLAALDIFCLPSLQQGLGTIMLEAMSLGRPVIASAVGGVSSVLRDEETGLVVPPRDSGSLARRILELLDDPVGARAIGEAGQRLVHDEFGTARMVAATASVYRDVLEEPVGD